MLQRIENLLIQRTSFAFETTLSTKSFVGLIEKAHANRYKITLVYFWLESVDLAVERVKKRVSLGGHNIPLETIKRRYTAGLRNFLTLYLNKVDEWFLFDNSKEVPETIAKRSKMGELFIANEMKWKTIKTI